MSRGVPSDAAPALNRCSDMQDLTVFRDHSWHDQNVRRQIGNGLERSPDIVLKSPQFVRTTTTALDRGEAAVPFSRATWRIAPEHRIPRLIKTSTCRRFMKRALALRFYVGDFLHQFTSLSRKTTSTAQTAAAIHETIRSV